MHSPTRRKHLQSSPNALERCRSRPTVSLDLLFRFVVSRIDLDRLLKRDARLRTFPLLLQHLSKSQIRKRELRGANVFRRFCDEGFDPLLASFELLTRGSRDSAKCIRPVWITWAAFDISIDSRESLRPLLLTCIPIRESRVNAQCVGGSRDGCIHLAFYCHAV